MDIDYSELVNNFNLMDKWDTTGDQELEKLLYGGTCSEDDEETEVSRVNHPSHYTSGRQEAIDTIEDAIKDAPDPITGNLQATVLKYLLRLWLKDNPKEDAEKARWYLSRLIEKL